MFLTENKLEQRIESLGKYIYRDFFEPAALYVLEEDGKLVNPAVPEFNEDWEKINIGDYWRGKDSFLWLHIEVDISAEWKNRKVVGLFDFGTTGEGNNSGFEAMLYLKKKSYHGVDKNHQEILLPDNFAGTVQALDFRLWSGRNPSYGSCEHKIRRAGFAWIDRDTEDLYYTGKTVLETLKILDENDPLKCRLRNLLNDSFLRIDWSFVGESSFYSSVSEALAFLKDGLLAIPKNTDVTVNCIGHTHIDMAWLWRIKNTREKASRSFSTVLRLMEHYPEYIFLQSQPQIYEYIKKDFPDIFDQIKKRVAEGRWEIEGSMWVEADCNLISGESFTRQILMAKKFAKEEFGKDMEYLWLPDVFGYSWAMPQILKKSGIHTFMTTKISWNQYNRIPNDTFWWKGVDGTEILTYFITTPDLDNDLGAWYYTYNGKITPYTVKGIWDNYKQKDINQELLLDYGYGDGGGGVNREMLEMKRRIDEMPGLPRVVSSTAGEYFRKLHANIENTEYRVPKWDGELYLELCQGTYTSHAANKKANRRMEFLYRLTEWYMAMVKVKEEVGCNIYKAHEQLNEGWKLILLNQFHDIIPGSSIHEVYEDSARDYVTIQSVASEIQKVLLPELISADSGWYTVVNAAGWDADSIIKIPTDIRCAYVDENDNLLPVQYIEDATLVLVKDVPAMGMVRLRAISETISDGQEMPFHISEHSADTPFYHIEWNEAGQLTSLVDLAANRQIVASGMRANVFQVFEDQPLAFDAWNIDIFYQEKHWEVNELLEVSVVEEGPLRAVIRMKWRYRKSTICQDIILYSENRRIDFQTTVDFHGHHQLLKVAFPVDIFANYATYDIQYGNMRRPNHWNTSWDMARYEVFAHRFADLSERNYGVSLMNDCKYGYDIKENIIRLSLIKTATDPDPEQDQGLHEFMYSLLPHTGDFCQGQTVKESFLLNQPMMVVPGRTMVSGKSFIRFSRDSVELDAVKESEDGKAIVIRFHDYTGGSARIQVLPGFPYEKWSEADLMENPTSAFHEEKEIVVSVKPYEIVTLLFKL